MSESSQHSSGHRIKRPSLRPNSMAGGSFLRDHEQYKPVTPIGTPPAPMTLDTLLRAPRNRLIAPLPLNFQPLTAPAPAAASTSNPPPTAGTKSTPPSQSSDQKPKEHPEPNRTALATVQSAEDSEDADIPKEGPSKIVVRDSGVVHSIFPEGESMAVTSAPRLVATLYYNGHKDDKFTDKYPKPIPSEISKPEQTSSLAPESSSACLTPEVQPLGKYYGPFITQLCLASFLQMVDSMATPYHRIHSSHRCLDIGEGSEDDHPRVVEVTVSPPPTHPEYFTFADMRRHEDIHRFEETWNVQLVLQPESVFRRYKRLAVFDMDSTLIEQEVIDEIAKFIGVEKEVSEITARAMNGELDFTASLQERVALLKGVPANVFDQLKPKIRITQGARQLCRSLKTLGCKMAVLSGGFQPLADWLAGELGLDYAFANHLEIDEKTQTLTGRLLPTSTHPIISPQRKRELLMFLAESNGILLSQVLAVGDGANDLPMLHAAGLGVAWNAKQKVQLEAPTRLNGESLIDIMFLLGFARHEIDELAELPNMKTT